MMIYASSTHTSHRPRPAKHLAEIMMNMIIMKLRRVMHLLFRDIVRATPTMETQMSGAKDNFYQKSTFILFDCLFKETTKWQITAVGPNLSLIFILIIVIG